MVAPDIVVASEADAGAWDAYARAHGTFFHRYGWARAIKQTYGHEPAYLMARRDGAVCGLLPLIDRKSFLFGRALISTAFTVGGGIVADDEAAKLALARAAADIGEDRGSAYVELRSADDRIEGWHEKHGVYDNFSVVIEPEEEARLTAIPRKKRADIRKAIKAASEGKITVSTGYGVSDFWRHYAQAQRDHGTPVFPRKWLDHQRAEFSDDFEVAMVEIGGNPVAGVVNYYEKDRVLLYNAFISKGARQHHAGDYLYWWMMGHARERGVSVFDLGRSKPGTGSHAYKTYWGFKPSPLVYLYRLMGTDEMPNVNPKNPKFALMTKVWERLPLPIANRLGPVLAGHLS